MKTLIPAALETKLNALGFKHYATARGNRVVYKGGTDLAAAKVAVEEAGGSDFNEGAGGPDSFAFLSPDVDA